MDQQPGRVVFHRIYVHRDKRGIVRYVGATHKDEYERLAEHWDARNGKQRNHRLNWLRSLSEPPTVEVIEWVRPEDRDERERYWIALYRDYGHNLVNGTDGGDGTRGYVFTPEVCAKISAAITGIVKSPECRRKQSEAHKGRIKTPEHCANISAALTGLKQSPELIFKAAEGKRGQKRPGSSSQYRGVHWEKKNRNWVARSRINCKQYHLGSFANEIDAAKAVDAFIRKHNLSPKLLNFL